mmetsp:Transcript_21070/g.30435  ORF Transcript_21070/g.30435 Transcript_21070/m.30435 type:complete len:317 (-) Transcript_21070:163-1113(-)
MKRKIAETDNISKKSSAMRNCSTRQRSPILLRSRKTLTSVGNLSHSVAKRRLPSEIADKTSIEKSDIPIGMDSKLTVELHSDSHVTPASNKFLSCLQVSDDISSPCGTNLIHLLKRAISVEELDDTSWLSSNMIDLVISQFAKWYPEVDFLSIDFVPLALNPNNHHNFEDITDILGHRLTYDGRRPIVLLCNNGNIHWTLIRVLFLPVPELQLYEPMGKPPNRTGQLSFRYVPRNVIKWLDTCCPLSGGRTWLSVTTSAVTSQHQYTSFDCGVACLLYAEKCGLGEDKETINASTTQHDITVYRGYLQEFIKRMKV